MQVVTQNIDINLKLSMIWLLKASHLKITLNGNLSANKTTLYRTCKVPVNICLPFAVTNEHLLMSAEYLCGLDYISLDLFGW